MREPFVPKLLMRIRDRAAIEVQVEPEFGFAGRIIFGNGNTHVFLGNNLNINRGGATALAQDKNYTNYFLRLAGLQTARELSFFSDELLPNLAPQKRRTTKDACRFAEGVGGPVIIKPNTGSLGKMVVKADTAAEIADAATRIFERYDVALAQEFVPGRDYRIVVLGDEIISAYERTRLHVIGDGRSTIRHLIAAKREHLLTVNRPNSEIDPRDPRIDQVLRRCGLTRDSILPDGAVQPLLDVANLSSGGEATDITNRLHPFFAQTAIAATRTVGLSLCGVDLICEDATKASDKYVILELNGAPQLDNYAATGEEQSRRVEEMYLKILRFLEYRTG